MNSIAFVHAVFVLFLEVPYKQEGKQGDLIVTFKLLLPTLNEKQKELLRKIKEIEQ